MTKKTAKKAPKKQTAKQQAARLKSEERYAKKIEAGVYATTMTGTKKGEVVLSTYRREHKLPKGKKLKMQDGLYEVVACKYKATAPKMWVSTARYLRPITPATPVPKHTVDPLSPEENKKRRDRLIAKTGTALVRVETVPLTRSEAKNMLRTRHLGVRPLLGRAVTSPDLQTPIDFEGLFVPTCMLKGCRKKARDNSKFCSDEHETESRRPAFA